MAAAVAARGGAADADTAAAIAGVTESMEETMDGLRWGATMTAMYAGADRAAAAERADDA